MEILQIFWTYQIFLFANLKQKWQIVDFGYVPFIAYLMLQLSCRSNLDTVPFKV